MSIKFLRPISPRPAAPRVSIGSLMGRPSAVRTGADRSEHLQDKLRASIMERRRLAAAQAGMPDTSRSLSGADMTNNDVQDHIRDYVQQKGSWIERRIARLQSEVKDAGR